MMKVCLIALVLSICSVMNSAALILRTEDSGRTWQREESGCRFSLNAVAIDLAGGIALCVGDHGTVLRRGDEGVWADVSPEGLESDLYSVAVGVGGLCMACGENGTLLSSFDGGLSWRIWEQFDHPDVDLLSVNFDPTHAGDFLVAGENGFLFSTAAGGVVRTGIEADAVASCARLCSGFPDVVIFRNGAVFSSSSGSSDGWIDGGSVNCATPVVSGGSFYIAAGDGGLISVYNGAWYSPDKVTDKDLYSVGVLVFGGAVCAVGQSGTILVSEDKGETWAPVPSGTSRDLNGIAGDGVGTGYIVGDSIFPEWFHR